MIPPLTLDLQLEGMAELDRLDTAGLISVLRAGAFQGAEFMKGLWIRLAQGMNVRATGAYLRGIESAPVVVVSESLGVTGTALDHWEILLEITNTAAHAHVVEVGHAAYSLPHAINWGRTTGRIKRTEDGRPYLHVVFRHRAYADADSRERQGLTVATIKAMMPEHIYARAKRLSYTVSHRVGPIYRGGQFVAADRYTWGGRLDRSGSRPAIHLGGPGAPNAGGPGEPGWEEHRGARVVGRDAAGNALVNPAWQYSKFHGLFKAGAPRHSQYLTIRTITPDSAGWRIPAVAGRFVAMRTAQAAGYDQRLQEVVLGGVLAALGQGAP